MGVNKAEMYTPHTVHILKNAMSRSGERQGLDKTALTPNRPKS